MRLRLLVIGLILAAPGCARHPAPATESAPAQAAPDLEALERELAQSEAELHAALGPSPPAAPPAPAGQPQAPAATGGAAPHPPSPAPPAEAEAPAAAAPRDLGEDRDEPAGESRLAEEGRKKDDGASPCDVACRALTSMRRSAEAICRLTGPVNDRCQNAEQRVAEARERVERARCGCR